MPGPILLVEDTPHTMEPMRSLLESYGYASAEATRSGVPVVAVTAVAMVGDRDAMLAAGFDAYIAKPLEPAQWDPYDRLPSSRAADLILRPIEPDQLVDRVGTVLAHLGPTPESPNGEDPDRR